MSNVPSVNLKACVFIGKHNGMLACQCNVCGYSHYSDGCRVESGGLEFASEMQLREFGLI